MKNAAYVTLASSGNKVTHGVAAATLFRTLAAFHYLSFHTGGGWMSFAGLGPASFLPEPAKRLMALTARSSLQRIWQERRRPGVPRRPRSART